jgi:hypothetical protein
MPLPPRRMPASLSPVWQRAWSAEHKNDLLANCKAQSMQILRGVVPHP